MRKLPQWLAACFTNGFRCDHPVCPRCEARKARCYRERLEGMQRAALAYPDGVCRGAGLSYADVSFQVIGAIFEQETIAVSREIRELVRLRKIYGPGRWRKRKGIARIKLSDGTLRTAELHWYEAHGIGRKELKIKRLF